MSAPPYIEHNFTLEHFKKCSEDKFFLFIEIKDKYFLVKLDKNDVNNLDGFFSWLKKEASCIGGKTIFNKPVKCQFDFPKTKKYKSLLADKGNKLDNIISTISDFNNKKPENINLNKEDIKKLLKEKDVYKNLILDNYINNDINTYTLNQINKKVRVLYTFKDYHFLNLLLLYDIPLILKDKMFVFYFREKEFDKFITDVNFISNIFLRKNAEESFFIISLLKKYSITGSLKESYNIT